LTLLLCFLIGTASGLRSLTPIATVAWSSHVGWLRLSRPLSLIGSLPGVAILTVLAFAELVADKLPSTPNRTSAVGLIARVILGGTSGACIAVGGGRGPVVGAALGATGGIAGAFGGYHARKQIAKALNSPDIYVALFEDLVAIITSIWIVARFK